MTGPYDEAERKKNLRVVSNVSNIPSADVRRECVSSADELSPPPQTPHVVVA